MGAICLDDYGEPHRDSKLGELAKHDLENAGITGDSVCDALGGCGKEDDRKKVALCIP